MDTQTKQELEYYLSEISSIVDLYNPTKEYLYALCVLSFMAICLIVISTVGILFGVLLLTLGLFPIIYMSASTYNPSQDDKDLSYKVCILMSKCIHLYKYPGTTIKIICEKDGNIGLYRQFVLLFPHMASKKLKKLASVSLRK